MNKITTLLLISSIAMSTAFGQTKKNVVKKPANTSTTTETKAEDLYSIDANDKITLTLKGA